MRRSATLLGAAMVVLGAGGGCATNPERLPAPDRQFYYNLETAEDQHAYLRLKESERQAFLQERGLWAQWAELPEDQKRAALAEEVHPGFKVFAAHMAWGPPADVRTETKRNRSVEFETYIKCTSGPRTGKYVRESATCDGTYEEILVSIENGLVTEVHYLD